MKIKLLALLLICGSMNAQNTHLINWFMGIPPENASMVIAPGDTVIWVFADNLPHSVTSLPGATEDFDSGILTGLGTQYSHIFTAVGLSAYQCDVHPMMNGVISVQSLAIPESQTTTLTVFPNPVNDILNIQSPTPINNIVILDVSGKIVLDAKTSQPNAKIYMSGFPSGKYFVKVSSGGDQRTVQILKN